MSEALYDYCGDRDGYAPFNPTVEQQQPFRFGDSKMKRRCDRKYEQGTLRAGGIRLYENAR